MGKEVILRTFINRYEAEMAKGLLDEKGIGNMISDEDVGGIHPGMIVRECSLIVNEEDLGRAKEAIKIINSPEINKEPYKNKTIVITCSLLLAGSVLSFADYIQGPNPNVLMQERMNEKMIFDYNQALYNDKTNTEIRSKNSVEKKTEKKDQEKKKVEEEQDQTKGQILIKF